ncbi:hypothetical protein SELMODRAFT_404960 [Selaginella moellendorffii]|uniref:Uncharacterized protein n=1 Tax=Selaginella moellendorffii TaxID=88036 RepID=D8QXX7_SELML|nr:hypothetical protein SELMODRAFT_404960 [Selaginella moellendorffii]
MRNFPSDRGVVVGLLQGFVPSSLEVYTAVYAPHTPIPSCLCDVSTNGGTRFHAFHSSYRAVTIPNLQCYHQSRICILSYVHHIAPGLLCREEGSQPSCLSCFSFFWFLFHTADGRQKVHPDADSLFIKTLKNSMRNSVTVEVGLKAACPALLQMRPLPVPHPIAKNKKPTKEMSSKTLRVYDELSAQALDGKNKKIWVTIKMAESLNSKSMGAFVALVSVWNFLGSGYCFPIPFYPNVLPLLYIRVETVRNSKAGVPCHSHVAKLSLKKDLRNLLGGGLRLMTARPGGGSVELGSPLPRIQSRRGYSSYSLSQ